MNTFTELDWIVIGIYFSAILGIAIWVMRQKQDSTEDYFLAGRNAGWFVIGASIFASNIGSEHIVGLAGTAAETGVVMGHYELHSYIALLLGWVFIPFYMRSRVFTMPEFMEKRYSSSTRWFLSVISLIAYVFTKISVTVYAGAIVFETLMGIEFWTGALIVIILTGIYTVFGGLRAVIYTETIQAAVLILGSVTISIMGLTQIGGWDNLVSTAGSDHFNLFKPMSDPNFPWLGMVLASPIVGIWYWCTDQYIVQRVLAGRDEEQARRGTIFAAYLKLLPFFIFIIPGIIAYALLQSGQLEYASSDQAFPALVKTLLPSGLRGLVAGGLLAALMSSLAAVFNSSSTLFTIDVYKKLKPETPDKKLVFIGRIATVVLVILGIIWIPVMQIISGQLYHYLQSVQAYIAPPIAAVFLLGIFWKRLNAKGAITALVGGFLVGMFRLLMEVFKSDINPQSLLYQFADVNFLYFAVYLFIFSILLLVGVSYATLEPNYNKISGLTYGTMTISDQEKTRKSWNYRDLVLSIIVLVIIAIIMIYFSALGIAS
jgi:solute:Na+ symporter, SSS family